jgi:ribosomal protein S24E
MKVIKEKDDKLFSRKEFLIEYGFSGKTPSNEEIKNKIVEVLKVNKELLVIKNIKQKYGAHEVIILAYVYKDINNLNKFQKINKKAKKEKVKKEEKKE